MKADKLTKNQQNTLNKLISLIAKIPLEDIISGNIKRKDWVKVTWAMGELEKLKIFLK